MTGQTLGDPSLSDLAYASVTHTVDQTFPLVATTMFLSFDTDTALTNPAMHDRTTSAVALTGTVAKTSGAAALTGTGTLFLSELTVGQRIVVGAETAIVIAITSNTAATVAALVNAGGVWSTTASGVTATVDNRSKVIVTEPGVYIVNGAAWASNTTGQAILNIFKGTGASPVGIADSSGAGGTIGPRLFLSSTPIRLAAGDVLWLGVYQNSGASSMVSTGISGRAPVFGFFRIAP